jgi:hypothetical protein
MQSVALRLQLHRRLERFRARVPYFVITGVIAALLTVPPATLLLLAQALGYRGTPDMSLSRSWWTLALAPLGIAVLFAIIDATGRVSGYRPFRRRWEHLSPHAAKDLSQRLLLAGRAEGFEPVWEDGEQGGFVAVRNMELETRRHVADGKTFPMRLSVFIVPADAAHVEVNLKLENRTVVVWDTGERETCRRIGLALTGGA